MRSDKLKMGLAGLLVVAVQSAAAQEAERTKMLEESRKVAVRLLTEIRGEVSKELERSGPLRAIAVCKYTAPETAAQISRQTGMHVARVSLRPRDPALGTADAWEQQGLLDFEKRLAKGEKVDALEISEVVSEPAGRFFRYMKAIPMGLPCLACHGPAGTLAEGVKAMLATEYPHDQAYGYQVGQVRGAVSIKKPL